MISYSSLQNVLVCIVIVFAANMIFVHRQIIKKDDVFWAGGDNTIMENYFNHHELPSIAWVMSYPNSGTSYTMRLTEVSTGTSVATNYGKEPREAGRQVKALFPLSSPLGPYILNPMLPLPQKFVLTKTHCSGYCDACPQSLYVLPPEKFLASCSQCRNGTRDKTSYNANLVPKKIIRLMRNPFDNIVSNYHHFILRETRKGTLKPFFTNDIQGFRRYCRHHDDKYIRQKKEKQKAKVARFAEHYDRVPCHQVFFRYIQWHNHAEYVSKRIQTLLVHYEDYERDFNTTTKDIFEFLEVEPRFRKPEFKHGKTYAEYFTTAERAAAWEFMQDMTKPALWERISGRYKS